MTPVERNSPVYIEPFYLWTSETQPGLLDNREASLAHRAEKVKDQDRLQDGWVLRIGLIFIKTFSISAFWCSFFLSLMLRETMHSSKDPCSV